LAILPRLRTSLDFSPSPVDGKPGLLIRDPFHYSDAMLIIPPPLVGCLEFFDGEQGEQDLRGYLVQLTGDLQVSDLLGQLVAALDDAGFLENETFERRRDDAEHGFAAAPVREAAHAGGGYPAESTELAETLRGYLAGADNSRIAPSKLVMARVMGIAAPHVSPFGGVEAYRAAYTALAPSDGERTFVILGTSHYGQPDRIGLTKKPFVTPFGATLTDASLVDELSRAAGDAASNEDYCHSFEHSIEFQVVFLQHLFGPRIRVLPVLCGSYARSLYRGGLPEDDERVRSILDALGEMAAREGDRLLWVLGVDMAHMGRRYGDELTAIAGRDEMEEVSHRDQIRIGRMANGDSRGFWELVQENHDDLKWCGSAPIYTFLKAVPQARGELLHYQQWNIDPQSVVSFAGMKFH
jgi:MEMO1 family protein